MAQQLVYTSAGKLLDAGRSGFGTVARSKSLSPLLVSAIERVSQFANIRGTERSRVIFVHRRIVAANNRVHLISRIADAGADYTGRTNHIAHHLIVSQEEMNGAAARGITPADVLMQFPWLPRWEGAPKFFGPEEDVPLERVIQPSGGISARAAWTRLTGNPSHARLLAWDGAPRNGVLLVPRGADPLALLAEALAEFGPQSWSRTFTTNLETTDEMADFDWVVSSPENFREIEARCGARALLDLSQSHTLPVPPAPVQATPQPKAALQVARQAYAIPISDLSHDTSKRQPPGVQAVKARVSSGSSPRHPISKPVSSHSWKVRMQMILASAALIVVLGVLGVAVWKAFYPEGDNKEKIAEKQRKDDKERALSILQDAKVTNKKAEEFVEKSVKNPKEWANYAGELLSKFQSPPQWENLRAGLSDEPAGDPSEWMDQLNEAKNVLVEYDCIDKKSKFKDKMEKLSKIHSNLVGIAGGLKNPEQFKKSADHFFETLALRELENLFGSGDSTALSGDEIKSIGDILFSHFNWKTKPDAYKVLCEFISGKFDKFVGSPVEPIFEGASATIKDADARNLKEALDCWRDSTKTVGDDLIKSAGKGFVPKDFEKLLNGHRSKNQTSKPAEGASSPQPEPPPDPVLSYGPEKMIIIVTRNHLKEGIEVILLSKILDAYHFPNKISQGLQIKVNEDPPVTEVELTKKYIAEGNKTLEFYAPESDLKSFKIQRSGKILLDRENAEKIKISFTSGQKIFEAWIVIDEPGGSPIQPLSFDLNKKNENENEVELGGEITKWMSLVTDNQLKIELPAGIIGVSLSKNGEVYNLIRDPIDAPLLFADADIKNVEKGLDLLKKKDEEVRGIAPGSKKDKAEAERTRLVSDLKDSLSTAIGGGILRRELNLKKDDPIKKEKWGPAKEVLKKMDVPKSSLSDNDWDKYLADIKKKIGENELDDTIKKEIPKFEGWDKSTKATSNFSKDVTSLIDKFKNYKQPSSLAIELKSVKSFEVKTGKGRVLFKATRQP
jgi:hypothetical protein